MKFDQRRGDGEGFTTWPTWFRRILLFAALTALFFAWTRALCKNYHAEYSRIPAEAEANIKPDKAKAETEQKILQAGGHLCRNCGREATYSVQYGLSNYYLCSKCAIGKPTSKDLIAGVMFSFFAIALLVQPISLVWGEDRWPGVFIAFTWFHVAFGILAWFMMAPSPLNTGGAPVYPPAVFFSFAATLLIQFFSTTLYVRLASGAAGVWSFDRERREVYFASAAILIGLGLPLWFITGGGGNSLFLSR